MLLEDCLREGFVVAEEVLDVPKDPIGCKGEPSDAGEEVEVAKRLVWFLLTISGSQSVHHALCARL